MARFEDHFSPFARDYAEHRPSYPPALFAYLASVAPGRDLVWDCGTGNGQAALELVRYFHHVYATDASAEQIGRAHPHERVEYRVESAEEVSLADECVDLVTVAVAAHWFDLDAFYGEVRRVLRPDGVIAAWTYHLPVIELAVDDIIGHLYANVLGGCWSEKFRHVHSRYAELPFPFEEFAAPSFEITAYWDLGALVGFIETWSAVQRFRERHGSHPLKDVWRDLAAAWGDPATKRPIRWPLYMRIGR